MWRRPQLKAQAPDSLGMTIKSQGSTEVSEEIDKHIGNQLFKMMIKHT